VFSGWAIRLRGAIALLRPSRRYKGAGTEESGKKGLGTGGRRGENGRMWRRDRKERDRVGKKGRENSTWIFVQGAPEFLVTPLRATQHLMPNVIVEMQNLQSQSNFFAKPVRLYLVTSASNATLLTFAGEHRPCSNRSTSPVRWTHSSKPATAVEWWTNQFLIARGQH